MNFTAIYYPPMLARVVGNNLRIVRRYKSAHVIGVIENMTVDDAAKFTAEHGYKGSVFHYIRCDQSVVTKVSADGEGFAIFGEDEDGRFLTIPQPEDLQ